MALFVDFGFDQAPVPQGQLIPPGINDSLVTAPSSTGGGGILGTLGNFGKSLLDSSGGIGNLASSLFGGLLGGGGGGGGNAPIVSALPPIGDLAADFRSQIPTFAQGVDLSFQPLDSSIFSGAAGDIARAGREQTGLNIDEAFGRAIPLAGQLSQDRLGQFQSILGAVSPQAAAIQQGRDNAILSFLSGEVPADVADQIARLGAERATRSGIGVASGRARNLEARDLGLTSLDLINRGLTASLQALPQDRSLASSLTVDPATLGTSFLNTLQQATVAPPSALLQTAATASELNQDIAFIREVAIQNRAITALELAIGLEQANIEAGATSSLAATQGGLTRDIATGQIIGQATGSSGDPADDEAELIGQAIGTAIGAALPIPGGAFIGGKIGKLIGDFF